MSKKVAVIIKDRERQYEGLRSSLGLLLEFHTVSMIVLDHEIDMTEEYSDNMSFIDEMEGTRYSNVAANVEKYGFQKLIAEDLVRIIRENEIVIPF